jgi:hypothetical protein
MVRALLDRLTRLVHMLKANGSRYRPQDVKSGSNALEATACNPK